MVARMKKPRPQTAVPTKAELLFKVSKDIPKWYSFENPSTLTSPSKTTNEKYDKEKCEKIYREEYDLYQKLYQKDQSSDYQWLQTSLSTTSKDRLAALVTLIRRSPIHGLQELENLVNLLRSSIQHRRDALTIAEILEDVFVNTYLPENRRLFFINQQPNQLTTKQAAALAFVEETVKQLYSSFIDLLQQIAHDPIAQIRIKPISMLERLLSQRPEQEKRLLELIVDKLGDPDSTVASKTLHLLNQLLEKHPGMKNVLVNEIERLLFRQNIRPSAQHYALCCLTAIIFTSQDNDLANKLIKIYFALFRLFSIKENVSSKFFAILLGGVTRAISFAKVDLENIMEHLNDLFRIVHSTNFKTSVRALQLLFRIAEQRSEIDERYFNALYKKLSEPEWKNFKMLSTFLNLIFKSMLKDTMEPRIRAFIKRLLQLCLFNDVPFICGILLLISEVVKRHPSGQRLLLFSQKPNILSSKGDKTGEDDDDEEEHFHDVVTEEDNQPLQIVPQVCSWDHKNLNKKTHNHATHYDIHKRNPLYCGSDYTCLHELMFLKNHAHPTVALFAQNIFDGKSIDYNGNPLVDFNSMRFFDRFVYKNPKKQITKHEILRKKSRHAAGHLYLPKGVKAVPVDSSEYTRLNSAHIPVDERFLYTFMKMRQENSELAQEKRKQKSSEDDIDDNESVSSVSDDEFDKYLDHFMDDMDKDEIDLDENDNNSVEDIASTVQRVHRTDELENDDYDNDEDEDTINRPFTLNDGDELSDDVQLDDNEHDTVSNQNIRENFQVNNEREMKQIKWELDRERTFATRQRRYDKHMKKTSKRKPKLTRREKRQQMNQPNIKKKKRVHFS
ncbi:unnamed protein product [Rotaria socialis]|uniref:CCAAT/enhancer-binding protein zeta n=2 Tax=Rotaria socialis TaxID=392032 RepID=A0A817QSI9_9BILA|nr:unnamed protein product [Rotaria socialis]CAF3212521.1 unnamed protein product [Rotaria socialis]CAF3514100.1 unnamed protein product [Rotaria socialis]CAF4193209.1 unnamed protein product [Rotaria socialis]CAF4258862.1 unnamed protein product [Rotaria socialis]